MVTYDWSSVVRETGHHVRNILEKQTAKHRVRTGIKTSCLDKCLCSRPAAHRQDAKFPEKRLCHKHFLDATNTLAHTMRCHVIAFLTSISPTVPDRQHR